MLSSLNKITFVQRNPILLIHPRNNGSFHHSPFKPPYFYPVEHPFGFPREKFAHTGGGAAREHATAQSLTGPLRTLWL